MSLDNVIALVQAARVDGEVSFLILGIWLVTTIPLVVFGAALLVYLAMEMFFADVVTHPYLEPVMNVEWVFGLLAAALFMLVAVEKAHGDGRRGRPRKSPTRPPLS